MLVPSVVVLAAAELVARLVDIHFDGTTRLLISEKVASERVDEVLSRILNTTVLVHRTCTTTAEYNACPYNHALIMVEGASDLVRLLNVACVDSHANVESALVLVAQRSCGRACLASVAAACSERAMTRVLIVSGDEPSVELHSYAWSCERARPLVVPEPRLEHAFSRRVVDFGGCALSIGSADLPPFMYATRSNGGELIAHGGPEHALVLQLATAFNFTPRFVDLEPHKRDPLDALRSRRVSLCSSPMYIVADRAREFAFTEYYRSFVACVMRARPVVPAYLKIARPFDATLWSVALPCFALAALFHRLFARASILDSLNVLVGNSIEFRHERFMARFSFAQLLALSLVLRTAYQAALVESLANEKRSGGPSSVAELVRARVPFGGKLVLRTHFEDRRSIYDAYRVVANELVYDYLRNVSQGLKFGVVIGYDDVVDRVKLGDIRELDVQVLDERVATNVVGMLYPKASPLRRPFYEAFLRFEASGLFVKWGLSAYGGGEASAWVRRAKEPLVMGAHHLVGAFVVLGVGFVLAITAFCIEIFRSFFQKN